MFLFFSLLENVLNFMRSNVDAGVHAPGQVEHHPSPRIQNISKEVNNFFGFSWNWLHVC
jgi:hypothetical protein